MLLLDLIANQAPNERSFSDLEIKKTRLRIVSRLLNWGRCRRLGWISALSGLLSVPRYADTLEAEEEDDNGVDTKKMDDALILHNKTESDQPSWNIKAMFKKQAEMAEEPWDSENFEDEILSAFVAQVYTPIQFEPLCL
ncbi:hypothetical protein B0H14DRAFT_3431151 [Mycena olivaceomarginata]|nr:hypothetical protein B0H14DRAFT_3431151 [Mycena olivaceomarginata]